MKLINVIMFITLLSSNLATAGIDIMKIYPGTENLVEQGITFYRVGIMPKRILLALNTFVAVIASPDA